MRILIAEDDFASRKFMLKFLTKYAEVDVTVDGQEAVNAFELALEDGEPYDLVCLDVMMPNMNGYELTDFLRKNNYNMPLLMVTAIFPFLIIS